MSREVGTVLDRRAATTLVEVSLQVGNGKWGGYRFGGCSGLVPDQLVDGPRVSQIDSTVLLTVNILMNICMHAILESVLPETTLQVSTCQNQFL